MNLIHLHPMLVHFPIALALVALLADVASYIFKNSSWLHKSAVALTVLAALGAAASLGSGYLFTKPVAGLAATIKAVHVNYALASTVVLVLAAIVGLIVVPKCKSACTCSSCVAKLRYLFTLLLIVAAVCISLTGMEGGSIVYDVWLF